LKIGVIGVGYVGSAMIKLLKPTCQVVSYDIRRDGDAYPAEELAECDFSVICVNTPMAEDGSCMVANAIRAVERVPTERVLIKSTVSPGTTDALRVATGKQVCFSPEYLRESTYGGPEWRDMAGIGFSVVGGEPSDTRWLVESLMPLYGPAHRWYQCSSLEAEIIKYMENAWLATKVTFVNEFYDICRVLGADFTRVREGWLMDPRVGYSHSAVFLGSRGYSGKCLPKDLSAIVSSARKAGYDPSLMSAVQATNTRFREYHDQTSTLAR
jgi:UDPglucose 6-dehydrogenase